MKKTCYFHKLHAQKITQIKFFSAYEIMKNTFSARAEKNMILCFLHCAEKNTIK